MSGITYSIGTWLVKPGREAEFIATWQDLALWTEDMNVGADEGTLVQDTAEPRRFFAFWPFESEMGVQRLRGDPKFKEYMMRMRAYCEDSRPSTARLVGRTAGPEIVDESTLVGEKTYL